MSILIAYATKNNTTRTCANLLFEKLPHADIVNLSSKQPDISEYDTIIIGSNIRFNYINDDVKKFIGNNIDLLMTKRVAIYICCGFSEKSNQYILHNFPRKLLDKCLCVECFGGTFNVKPYRIYDKFVMKTVIKNYKLDNRDLPKIDNKSIINMIKEVAPLK